MKLNAYTIHDSAPQVYNRPLFAQSDAEAMRTFDDECVRDGSPIAAHPEHYSMWRIGTFDQTTGNLHEENPTCLAKAIDRISAQQRIEPGSLKDVSAGGTS